MANNRGINATYSATQIGIGTSMTSNCQMSHEKYGVCNKNWFCVSIMFNNVFSREIVQVEVIGVPISESHCT